MSDLQSNRIDIENLKLTGPDLFPDQKSRP